MNLKKSFLDFCENKQYEINPNQLDVIKDLKDYHKNNRKKGIQGCNWL